MSIDQQQVDIKTEVDLPHQSTPSTQTNLIVNYLPQTLSDDNFYSLFSSIGPLATARVIRDKITGYSFGYGFVDYQNAEDAANAIQQLDKHHIEHKVIKVAYSKPSGVQTKNINLYVAGLTGTCTEALVRSVFSKYGTIVQCNVINDKYTQQCQGIGFVLFASRPQADNAINALNGQKIVELGDKTITVKFAKNEQQRNQGHLQQHLMLNRQHPSLLQQPLLHQQQQQPQHISQALPYHNTSMRSYSGGHGSIGSSYHGTSPIRGIRMIKDQRYSPIMRNNCYTSSFSGSTSFGVTGNNGDQSTQGRVCFVYGIGPNANENDLHGLFSPIGPLQTIRVITDHKRGVCKGYGFVTFHSQQDAQKAVILFDKQMFQGRALQVSIKT